MGIECEWFLQRIFPWGCLNGVEIINSSLSDPSLSDRQLNEFSSKRKPNLPVDLNWKKNETFEKKLVPQRSA